MGVDRTSGIAMEHRAMIQRYPQAARRLPDPTESWTARDVDIPRDALRAFSVNGVIKSTGRQDGAEGHLNVWQTAAGIVEWAENHTSPPTTPCENATGIRTLTAGETYTCTDDDCDCRMDRETAEEVVA